MVHNFALKMEWRTINKYSAKYKAKAVTENSKEQPLMGSGICLVHHFSTPDCKQSSGRNGRATRQYDPFAVADTALASLGRSEPYMDSSATVTAYDVLGRATEVRRPLGVTTLTYYDIRNDGGGRRFFTKVTDPSENDVWEVDNQGNIVNRVEDKTRDAFYMLDNKGNRIKDACIEFNYGTITNTKTISLGKGSYDMYQIKGDANGEKLFEFLADNTMVEWSHTKTGKNGDKAPNFITTSHSDRDEKGGSHLWGHRLKYGYAVREMNHSHPNGIPIPSGMPGTSQSGKGDIAFATTISKHYGEKGANPPLFNVYNCNGGYVPYSQSSVVSDYSKTMDLYGITFNNNGMFYR